MAHMFVRVTVENYEMFREAVGDDRVEGYGSGFDAKIAEEIEGVLAWAVIGAKRLCENDGQFTVPTLSIDAMAIYRDDQNPIAAFVRARLFEDPQHAVPLVKLAEVYAQYDRGARKLDARAMGRAVRSAGFVTKDVRYRGKILKSLMGFRVAALDMPAELSVDREASDGTVTGYDAAAPRDESVGIDPTDI